MQRSANALGIGVVLVTALAASRAGAPPPVSSFPADVRPGQGSTAPSNARVWAFGKGAPALSDIGLALRVEGAPVAGELTRLGCCGVVFTPSAPLAAGSAVDVIVSANGGEVTSSFVVGDGSDGSAPTLSDVTALQDDAGALVLGVEGDDDVALAGFLARSGAEVVSAAPPGFVLELTVNPGECVDVVAVDLAGNESDAEEVCTSASGDDAGPAPEPPPVGGCPGCQGASPSLSLLLLPLLGLAARRARRGQA